MKLGTLTRVREFTLGNAVIRSRTLGVGHAAIQSFPKRGTAVRSALLRISALSRAWLLLKSYSGRNTRVSFLITLFFLRKKVLLRILQNL